jgi:hypothetical protein
MKYPGTSVVTGGPLPFEFAYFEQISNKRAGLKSEKAHGMFSSRVPSR